VADRRSVEAKLRDLLEQYDPLVRDAFIDAIADIRDQAQIRALSEALERGDINAALDALGMDRGAFRELENAIAQAYEDAGIVGAEGFPKLPSPSGGRVLVRFDVRAPSAERWLREESARLITGILDDTRTMIRNVMTDALERGRGPMATALDLAGRVQPGSNRRSGGLIGLTSQQERAVASAREKLLSGDPKLMREYLTLKRRDRRFDKTVLKAIRKGRPVEASKVSQIAGRLSDGYLKLRGETIARTETLASVNAGRREAFMQGLAKTEYTEADIEREWDSTGDKKVRASHRALDGEKVQGLTARYSNGLLHPGDLSGPPEEVINCRCVERLRINYFRGN
jgi:uncharacterized protein YdbL (DUF1318 family)